MSIQVILAILQALPGVAAAGTSAWHSMIDGLKTGDAEIDAKLEALKTEAVRRRIISETEANEPNEGGEAR